MAMVQGNSGTASATPASDLAKPVTGVSAGNTEKPLEQLANADAGRELRDLPGSALSFVDLANRTVKPLPAKPERYASMYRFNA